MRWTLALLPALVAGCWVGADGSHHRVVVGVGLVSTHSAAGVSVDDVRLLGVYTGRDSVAAGVVGAHEVAIDPRVAPAVVSIRATPWSLGVTTTTPCQGGSAP